MLRYLSIMLLLLVAAGLTLRTDETTDSVRPSSHRSLVTSQVSGCLVDLIGLGGAPLPGRTLRLRRVVVHRVRSDETNLHPTVAITRRPDGSSMGWMLWVTAASAGSCGPALRHSVAVRAERQLLRALGR